MAIIILNIIWLAVGMISVNNYKNSENSIVIEEHVEELLPEEN